MVRRGVAADNISPSARILDSGRAFWSPAIARAETSAPLPEAAAILARADKRNKNKRVCLFDHAGPCRFKHKHDKNVQIY